MKNNFWQFVCIILLAVILLQHACTGGAKTEYMAADTVRSVEYVYDSVVHKITVPVPSPAGYVYIEVPADVDTAAILQAYYNEVYYEDNYQDSVLDLFIREGISQNQICYRDISYKILRPTEINTTEIHPPAEQRTKVFAGIRIGGNKEALTSFVPELQLITKKDKGYSIGYNLQSSSVEFGLLWKISFKKK